MTTKDLKLLMLIGPDESSIFMYNGLKNNFNIVQIIEEDEVARKKFIQKRIKKLGYSKVFGQILFVLFSKYLSRRSQDRIKTIKRNNGLISKPIPESILQRVKSINDQVVIELINKYEPDLIIVNGTRIIKKNLLQSTNALFINTHMGITPRYRGVHGGYWALVEGDSKNCGVTIHIIDEGIDTGPILNQDRIETNSEDNFTTYTYHQIAKAIPLMNSVINDFQTQNLKIIKTDDMSSKIWSHPSISQYIYNRIFKKIR